MLSAENIKFGLEICNDESLPCEKCPYYDYPYCEKGLMSEALLLIKKLQAKVPKWISVEERLPEKHARVLGACSMGVMEMVYTGSKWWTFEDSYWNTVTHWMPLPEPPVEV